MARRRFVAKSDSSASVPDIEMLVDDHSRALYAYALRLTGQASDAEDLTQQVFLIAQQKLHQLRDAAKALQWLFRILRNEFLTNKQRKSPTIESDSENEVVQNLSIHVEDTPIDSEQIQMALMRLSDEFRVVVLMYYFEELSYKEIAVQLNLPVGTVMSRLARAKSSLRAKLGSESIHHS